MSFADDYVTKYLWLDCDCRDVSHALRFYRTDWGDEVEFGAESFLNHYLPWYQRLGEALLYVFGYQARQSHFDSWLMKSQDKKALIEFLQWSPYDDLLPKTEMDLLYADLNRACQNGPIVTGM